jgi:hypothetical protein
MISMAIKIDNRIFETSLKRKGHYSQGQGRKQPKQTDYWPQPMELGAAYRKQAVPKEEMDRRRKNKLCFECGKEGHIASFHRKGRRHKQLNATGRGGYNRSKGTPRELCVTSRKPTESKSGKGKGSVKAGRALDQDIKEAEELSREELVEARKEHAQAPEEPEDYDEWSELDDEVAARELEAETLRLEVELLKQQL